MNVPDHMTKMAIAPIYDKNLQNIHFQNRTSYDLETRHAASGTKALQS